MASILERITTAELSAKCPVANHDTRGKIDCGLSCVTCMYAACGSDYHKQKDPDRAFCLRQKA